MTIKRWNQMRLADRIATLLGSLIAAFALLLFRDWFVSPASRVLPGGSSFLLAPASFAVGALFLNLGLAAVNRATRDSAGDPLVGPVAVGALLLVVGSAGWVWAALDKSENGLLGLLLAIVAGVPGLVLVSAGGSVLVYRRLRRSRKPQQAGPDAAQSRQ